jgi:hypothetical protein
VYETVFVEREPAQIKLEAPRRIFMAAFVPTRRFLIIVRVQLAERREALPFGRWEERGEERHRRRQRRALLRARKAEERHERFLGGPALPGAGPVSPTFRRWHDRAFVFGRLIFCCAGQVGRWRGRRVHTVGTRV